MRESLNGDAGKLKLAFIFHDFDAVILTIGLLRAGHGSPFPARCKPRCFLTSEKRAESTDTQDVEAIARKCRRASCEQPTNLSSSSLGGISVDLVSRFM
jgi:hypothetical protein